MPWIKWIKRSVLCAALLGFLGGVGLVYGQVMVQPVTPTVLSGPDVGFRIEGMRGATPIGTVVVRVNGQWVPVDFGSGTRPLGTR